MRGRESNVMIYDSITQLVGGTPLVRLNSFGTRNVLLKMESLNPLHSVKDRLALGLIRAAERNHQIEAQTIILEPTSGNTGIGLAFVCAARGYQLTLVIPENMTVERRKLVRSLGAEVILTPAKLGMPGAIELARQMASEDPNYLLLGQFENPANPEIHRITTAEEIWADTEGDVDIVVAGVGTGGTLTGIARGLKEKKPEIQIVAVEPAASPVLSQGEAGLHRIQGIGPGFVPDILDLSLIDEVITVTDERAQEVTRQLALEDGILAGISSGANVWAALEVAHRLENRGKLVVTIICDTGERYLSTTLFDDRPEPVSAFIS